MTLVVDSPPGMVTVDGVEFVTASDGHQIGRGIALGGCSRVSPDAAL
jgi:hypothetical protein